MPHSASSDPAAAETRCAVSTAADGSHTLATGRPSATSPATAPWIAAASAGAARSRSELASVASSAATARAGSPTRSDATAVKRGATAAPLTSVTAATPPPKCKPAAGVIVTNHTLA